MKLEVPPFPFSDEIISIGEMANLLGYAIPEPDRTKAVKLLVTKILPVKLAGIDRHPSPQRLSSIVYRKLGRILTGRAGNMRLHALKLMALETELERIHQDALNLAITQFLQQATEPLDAERLERWVTPVVQDLRMLPAGEIAEQAGELIETLDSWQTQAKADFPAQWGKHRNKYFEIRSIAEAAKQASFTRAAGKLVEFLRDADQQPELLTFD